MKQEKRSVVNTGTASMIVIFIGISLSILAALALSGARNDYNMSKKMAEHTTEYYEALNEAEKMLSDIEVLKAQHDGEEVIHFEIPMNEKQALELEIRLEDTPDGYFVETCRVINTDQWQGEDFLPVWQ